MQAKMARLKEDAGGVEGHGGRAVGAPGAVHLVRTPENAERERLAGLPVAGAQLQRRLVLLQLGQQRAEHAVDLRRPVLQRQALPQHAV